MSGIRKRPRQLVRSKRGVLQGGKSETPAFRMKPNLGPVAPQASMQHYWHPNRAGVEHAPESFQRQLHEMHPDLHCCRPPVNAPVADGSAWLFWYRRPRVTHRLCPGWLLLFAWRNSATNQPEPLDARCFAVLYGSSAMKFGSGAEYFKRAVEEKMADAKKSRDRAFQSHRRAKQRELTDSHRITSAGTGSKFARHHDGSVVPSRGDLNWHLDNRRRILPPELIASEDAAKERHRAATSDARRELRKLTGIQVP